MFNVLSLCNSLSEGFLALGQSQNMACAKKDDDVNIRTWALFRNSLDALDRYKIAGLHVFNSGESAFLFDENDDLFEYGAANPCFALGQEADTPRKSANRIFNCIDEICTGAKHVAILDSEGAVYCWGDNSHGQLGVGNTHSYLTPKQPQLPFIIRISCGQYFTIALDAAQGVWFWGRQYKGASVRMPIRAMPTPVSLPELVDIVCISAGRSFASAVDIKGQIHTWGHRECGVDFGYRKGCIKTTLIKFQYKVRHLVNSAFRSAFITENGRLFISGSVEKENYLVFTEIIHCGKVVTVAASWCCDKFSLSNISNSVFELNTRDNTLHTDQTSFKSVIQSFKYLTTPSIVPKESGQPGGVVPYVKSDKSKKTSTTDTETKSERTGNAFKPNPNDCDGYIEVASLFNYQVCTDIEIKFSDDSLFAHKLVLFLKSRYFRKLFEGTDNESKTIDMSNWSSQGYKAYIKYLYTGKIEFESAEHIPEIYLLAEQDINEKIKALCKRTWKDRLDKKNVVRLFQTAFNCQIQEFIVDCAPLLSQNLVNIVDSEDYKKLSENAKLSLALTAAMHGKQI